MTALLSQNLARAGVARLWTIADVALLPRILAQGDVDYELHDGRIIILAPAGDMHSSSQTNLIFELVLQGQRKGLGVTRTEPGIILRRDPDHMLVPGVALMPTASLPLQLSPEGILACLNSITNSKPNHCSSRWQQALASQTSQRVKPNLPFGLTKGFDIDSPLFSLASRIQEFVHRHVQKNLCAAAQASPE